MNVERLKQTLVRHEGTGPVKNNRFFPYKCPAGYTTIGIGRNLDAKGISEDEAELMLKNDIAEAIGLCRILFPVFDQLNDVRQEALVNMMFNLGLLGLSKFKKFVAAVNNRNWDVAAQEMENSLWFKQVGNRAKELQAMILGGNDKT